jgi:hypothetical protein
LIDPTFAFQQYSKVSSKTPIDVVIPIVEKDLITAKHVIPSIRAMILHPIEKIYLVAPDSEKIKQFAKEMNCEFILENDVSKNFTEIKKHGGWILQQFLKLNADKISKSENILIVDADTIFLRPQIFINDKKNMYTFNIHDQYFLRRKKFTKKLLKTNVYFKLDFTAHHMIFKRSWLKEFHAHIEKSHNKPWEEAILDLVKDDSYGFADYDVYATYVMLYHPENTRVLASANASIYRDRFEYIDMYKSVYQNDFKSISCHAFMLSATK